MRDPNLSDKFTKSLSNFCKLTLSYDAGLSVRTTRALERSWGAYNNGEFLTGWHLLTSGHTARTGTKRADADDRRIATRGIGLSGFRELSRFLSSHFIPHLCPDELSVHKAYGWDTRLPFFIDAFAPLLVNPHLLKIGKEITSQFENDHADHYYYNRREERPAIDTSLYAQFNDAIDEALGLPSTPSPNPENIYAFIFDRLSYYHGRKKLTTPANLHLASSRAALGIYHFGQNEAGDPVIAEYLSLREKHLFQSKSRDDLTSDESDRFHEVDRSPAIRLKLWQDFTAAAYPESPALQDLKTNLDKLGNRYVSRKQFGFPVSLCPK